VTPKSPVFTLEDAHRAYDEWRANCGPGAIAGVLGLTLDQVRPHLRDFERKRYMNPTMMFNALRSLGVRWIPVKVSAADQEHNVATTWPRCGLVRIQWCGQWTEPGVPRRARYRATHWIGAAQDVPGPYGVSIFDINCMNVGGWVTLADWAEHLVPWLLKESVPKANGKWHQADVLELDIPLPLAL